MASWAKEFFSRRTIVGANAVMLVFGTLYAQQVPGYSAVRFGLTSLVFPAMAAVGSILRQSIVLRVGFRPSPSAARTRLFVRRRHVYS